MKVLLSTCCLVLLALSTWAQTKTVTGQIIGPDKEPVIGAAVLEKGTNNGAQTDIDGNFTIAVKDSGNPVLVVSYVGMKTQEIPVGNQSNISVAMEDDAKVTEEVVVVGYGTIKKSDLTGSVSSLKPADVKQVPAGDVRDAIQGKAAGVDIVRASGETGKAPSITIRGNRSISASNDPLYIVDGVQYSSIQDINANDILSMEVLKDASSTAIYGARGSNGVIIVTTKKGAAGELKVSVNSYLGLSKVENYGFFQGWAYPMANSGEQYAQLKREAARTTNPLGNYVSDDVALGSADYANYQAGIETNYTKELLKSHGLQKDVQVGISGGTDKFKTYFSLDYFNEQGILKNDNLTRYTGRLNLDYNLNKYIKVGTQTQITYYDQNKRVNPLGNASKIDPLTTPYNEQGGYVERPGGVHANPLIDLAPNTAVNKINTLRIFPTIYAEVTPIKGLTARTNLAINHNSIGDGSYFARSSYKLLNSSTSYSISSFETQTNVQLNWQGILSYNKTVANNHNIGILGLTELITNTKERYLQQAYGQLLSEQLYYNMAEVSTGPVASKYTKQSLLSFAGRLNYSYKGKYLLQATGRWDGASQLAEGNKWNFFPSVSGGWRVSDEKFMDWQKTFSTIKLRGSWGLAGNAFILPYATQSTLVRFPFAYDNTATTAYLFNPQIGNARTTWEKSSTVDIGLDLGVFKERITLGFDYYHTNTNDLLLTQVLPLSTGVTQTVNNIGKTQNIGQEVTLTSVNIQTKKFTWSSTLTFMRNREKIVSLTGNQTFMPVTTTDADGTPNATKIVVVGAPGGGAFYDYEKIGLWQADQQEEINQWNANNPTSKVAPGMIKIKDQNGDGKITTDDRTVVGSTVPKWSGGFNSDFKYLNFDLNIYLFARYGSTINYQYAYSPTGVENSLSTREYWTPENPGNDLPRPGYTIDSRFQNTYNYVDGSFLKVRNITLGYTLPSSLTEKIKISRLRFYVTIKNLMVFSKQKNYDPELNGSLTFPQTTLYVGGFNLDF